MGGEFKGIVKTPKARSTKGVTTIALVLAITFFGILPLAIFGFELVRYFLIQEQLRNITDAAALSGSAGLASMPSAPEIDPDTGVVYTFRDREFGAMVVAAEVFAQNTIMETAFNLPTITDPYGSMSNTLGYTSSSPSAANVAVNLNPTTPTPLSPAVYNAALNIILLDQNGNTVTTGTAAASMRVQAYFSDKPVFLSNLGTILGSNYYFTVAATSDGGLPAIDLMLCFDTSGSMDDQTDIILVKRYFKPNTTTYTKGTIAWTGYSKTTATPSVNTIYNLFGPPPTGTQLNAFFPQNLSYGSYTKSGSTLSDESGNGFVSGSSPCNWSETPYSGGEFTYATSTNGLRANITQYTAPACPPALTPEQGLPPGDFDPTSSTTMAAEGNGITYDPGVAIYTDMVVVPSGTVLNGTYAISPSISSNGFSFTTYPQLVEASRGNLETTALYQSATGYTWNGVNTGISEPSTTALPTTVGVGYYNAYWLMVLQNESPMYPALQAAYDFYNTMQISANSHFGLETFAGTAATTTGGATETVGPYYNTDSNYALDSSYTTTLNLPCIALNPSTNNYTTITNTLVPSAITSYPPSALPLLPSTGTDISDALTQAITIMTNSSYTRSTAKQAIILFTDGVPNEPTDYTVGYSDAITAAQTAGAANPPVPIYTIGLSQNATILPYENNLLGDGPSFNSDPKGIAYYSDPNIARYYSVTSTTDLETAFQSIARSLCVIQ